MAETTEYVKVDNSTEKQGKDPELQKLEDDVNNLVDEDSGNDPEKLNVTLTTGFVASIPEHTAKNMLNLIKGKFPDNNIPQQLTELVTVLNSIVIKPNINANDLSDNKQGGNMYDKNLEQGESINDMITEVKTNIDNTITTITSIEQQFPDNQELQQAKNVLEKTKTIIDNPNSANTQSLQKFILNNLPKDQYDTFLKENFGPKGSQQKDPKLPDGYFGKNTIKGIDSCLTRLNNYIEEITKAKSIQEKANQKANKPDGVPTGNVDTRVDDLSTNVDYQALQSLSKLIESSQALLNNPEKFNKLLENGKINQDLVNSLKNDSDKVMEFAISLEKYESIGQINNMVKDRSNKNNKLNDVKGKIEEKELGNYTEESEDDATTNQITLEINNLKKQEEQLKAEMDALYLKIANAKWDYQVTMIRKDEIEKQLMDGMPLMIDYTKRCVILINQMLDVLDSEGEQAGDKEMKIALIDFKASLLETSGLTEDKDAIDEINKKQTNQLEGMSGWRFVKEGSTDFDVSSLIDLSGYDNDKGIVNFPTSGKITANVDWIIPNVIRYAAKGGTEVENQTGYYDDKIPNLETARTGYNFSGWYYTGYDGTEKEWNFTEDVILYDKVIKEGEYSGDIDLFAKWNAIEYTLNLDFDGGECEEDGENTCWNETGVYFDSTIPALPIVTKTGYTFDHYYTGDNKNNIITGGETTYTWPESSTGKVAWIAKQYTINLNPNGGSVSGEGVENNAMTGTYDKPLTLPTPTRDGYDFSGWMDLDHGNEIIANDTFSGGYDIDTGLNLKADWTPKTYTINFDSNSGTAVEPIIQAYLSSVNAPSEPTRDGYNFLGWYDLKEGGNKIDFPFEMPLGGKTLYAHWSGKQYTINIDLNGGTGTYDKESVEVTFGEPIGEGKLPTAENVSKTGYTFGGVSNIELGEDYTGGTTYDSVGNSTGTVLWIANKYPITLDASGGKVNDNDKDSITGTYNAEVKLPTPVYTGHNFQGWYSGDQKFGTSFTYNLTTGLNLVAKRELANYTLTFDTNGGTVIDPITTGYLLDIPEITNPTRTGYTFTGWYSLKEGGEKIPVPSKMPLNGQTIYAHWDANTYQLSFDFNGGTGNNTPNSVKFDQNIRELPIATNTGFIFDGWKIGSTFITPGTKYTRPNDSTAIAQWSTPTAGGNNGGRSGGGSRRVTPSQSTDYEGEVDSSHGSAVDEDDEYHIAHRWAYEKGLTSFANFDDARMFEDLTRAEMAKISSIFATKFYDKIPDTSAEKSYACSQYADLADVNEELQGYIIQSCELGYMGYLSNGIDYLTNFRPNDKISRAEVAIVFSRIMWGNEYAGDENHWYEKHLQAMFDQGIIHNISTPFKNEMRGDVFIMLSRVDHVQ